MHNQMPKIHIFTTVEKAVSLLQKYNKSITKGDMSKEEIVIKSVSSNIFRAFHSLNKNRL